MAADARLTADLDQLIALFNERSLDLPDGVFARQTQFRLNGIPFDDMLGRPPGDPLVRMLARGPAGYRFIAKAVQHAIPDARVQRGELMQSASADGVAISGQCWLAGMLRGTHEAAEMLIDFVLTIRGNHVESADASIDPGALEKLRVARLTP